MKEPPDGSCYFFFLCRFFRSLFFLLCLAIFARLRFFPLGMNVTL